MPQEQVQKVKGRVASFLRKIWPYLAAVAALVFALLFVMELLDAKGFQQSLAQARRTIDTLDRKIREYRPVSETATCSEKSCPECPEAPSCPECAVCDPPTVCTDSGRPLPNGICIRPRLTVEGDRKSFWLDMSFHFPGESWVGKAPVTDGGFLSDDLARPTDDDLWTYLNQGPDRYRFRLRESEFGWAWVTDQTGRKKVAFDWREPRISEGRVELGITICTTLRDW